MKKPKFIDLFAGIGGFHIALGNAGAKCVFASEWDEHARKTYMHNFDMRETGKPGAKGDPLLAGDITQVPPEEIPDFDILCAGFPCQTWSSIGKQLGFDDARGTLFFNIAEIAKVKRPAVLFLENVKNLAAHDNGRTIQRMKETLLELGYHPACGDFVHHINAYDYGVPQNRQRVFIVAFLDPAAAARFKLPKHVPIRRTLREIMGGFVAMSPANPTKERTIGFTLRLGGQNSGINDRHNWDTYLVDGQETRLTPEQGLQLQGFPDTFSFPEDLPGKNRMNQLGNSVPVPAVEAWAKEILNALKNNA